MTLLFSILYFAVPLTIVAVLLYWIIRMGVKHGMRSYYNETEQRDNEFVEGVQFSDEESYYEGTKKVRKS